MHGRGAGRDRRRRDRPAHVSAATGTARDQPRVRAGARALRLAVRGGRRHRGRGHGHQHHLHRGIGRAVPVRRAHRDGCHRPVVRVAARRHRADRARHRVRRQRQRYRDRAPRRRGRAARRAARPVHRDRARRRPRDLRDRTDGRAVGRRPRGPGDRDVRQGPGADRAARVVRVQGRPGTADGADAVRHRLRRHQRAGALAPRRVRERGQHAHVRRAPRRRRALLQRLRHRGRRAGRVPRTGRARRPAGRRDRAAGRPGVPGRAARRPADVGGAVRLRLRDGVRGRAVPRALRPVDRLLRVRRPRVRRLRGEPHRRRGSHRGPRLRSGLRGQRRVRVAAAQRPGLLRHLAGGPRPYRVLATRVGARHARPERAQRSLGDRGRRATGSGAASGRFQIVGNRERAVFDTIKKNKKKKH